MAIHIVDKKTELEAGQFMCIARCAARKVYGPIRRITSIKGKRIYFDNGPGRSSYMNRLEIAFVCDTLEEAELVVAFTDERKREREEEISRVQQRLHSEFAIGFCEKFGVPLEHDKWAAVRY
jgi:hypothetical protein